MIQAHIFYSGHVQGVGFRYAVCTQAEEFGLTGWVKNLADGRVESLIEGPREKIEKLNEALEIRFPGYIKTKTVDYLPAYGTFEDFQISHY